jgi:hypothetical protein
LTLPDVEVGADFGSLQFKCSNCGTLLIRAEEIQRFGDPHPDSTTNAVWTLGVPDTVVQSSKKEWNDVKECFVQNTYCRKCLGGRKPDDPNTFSIGSTYSKEFANAELNVQGT